MAGTMKPSTPVVAAMENDLAGKMAQTGTLPTRGPKTTPPGWTKGKKTGWNGGLKPPGLARAMTGGKPTTTPTEPPRTGGTPRTAKPPEFGP